MNSVFIYTPKTKVEAKEVIIEKCSQYSNNFEAISTSELNLTKKTYFRSSDVLIIEASEANFELGYHLENIANERPSLLLFADTKSNLVLNSEHITHSIYTEHNLANILTRFLGDNRKNLLSQRFNFFLSPSQHQHLKIEANNNDTNASEYLRQLIELDMGIQRNNF